MNPTIRLGIAVGLALAIGSSLLPARVAAQSDSLTGRVVDQQGQPVAGASVALVELQRVAAADSAGAFVLAAVPPGRYTLVVRHPGFAARALDVVAGAGAQPLVIDLEAATIEVEPVTVTATRLPISMAASPLPAEALGAGDLRQEHGVSLSHVLAGLPGVRSLETGMQIGKPVVRGLYGSRVLVLANGSRVEDYSWSDEDGPSLDARTAGRVEVIRGPASVLYGSDAIGGVVNVVPAPLPAAGESSFVRTSYELYGASNNVEGGAVFGAEGAARTLGWRVTAIGRAAGNLHTPAGELDNTGFFALNGEAAAALRGTHGNTGLSFSHYGGEFHLLEAGGPPSPPPPGGDQGGPVRKSDDERVQLTDDRVLSEALRLETKAQWERHSLIEVLDEGAAAGGGEATAFDLLLNTWSADVLLHHGAAGPLRGTVGVSGLYQSNGVSGPVTLVPDATAGSAAAFAFEEIALGPAWSLVAGARGDLRRLTADSNAALGLGAQTRDYAAWSGDVGLVFRPLAALSIAANVGRAWRAPNLFELFANGPLVSDNRWERGDAALRPENGTDLDLSLRWMGRGVRAEVAAFRNEISRYIYIQPTAQVQDSLPVFLYTQASARLEGGEASVEAAASPALVLRAGYDFVRGTNLETGEPLPLMAPPRLTLGATWSPAGSPHVRLGLETEVFARQTRLNPLDVPTGGHTDVDYVLLDLTGGLDLRMLGRSARLDVRVQNALNTRYRSFLSRYKEFADDPGRNVVLRLSL